MRKNLEVVREFKKHGIDFVPVPVRSSDHKKELIAEGFKIMSELSDEGNKEI